MPEETGSQETGSQETGPTNTPTEIIIPHPDLKVTLGPEQSGQIPLTVYWQGTSLQETTNQVTLMLNSGELKKFFEDVKSVPKGGTATIGPDELTFSPGVASRPDAVTVDVSGKRVLESVNQGLYFWAWQGLNVAFPSRTDDEDNQIDPESNKGPIRAVEFSKENYVSGLEYTEEWRATWQRAIALAWSDPGDDKNSLKSQLLTDPFNFFKVHCNYALPPTVNLVVVDAEKVMPSTNPWGFVPDPSKKTGPYWKWVLPRSVLVMFLPPAPEDPKDHAIALAAYEAVGNSYPFTVTS